MGGERGEDQGDPAGFAAGKAGCRGTSPFPGDNLHKKDCGEASLSRTQD